MSSEGSLEPRAAQAGAEIKADERQLYEKILRKVEDVSKRVDRLLAILSRA